MGLNLQKLKPHLFQNSVKFLLPYRGAYSNYPAVGIKLRKWKSPHSETIVSERTYQFDEKTNRGGRLQQYGGLLIETIHILLSQFLLYISDLNQT